MKQLDDARNAIRPATFILGAICIASAALKLFGFRYGIQANTSELALVGIGLLHI